MERGSVFYHRADQQKILLEAAHEASLFGFNATVSNSDANFNALSEAGLNVVETDVESFRNTINYDAYEATQSDAGKEIMAAMGK